MNLNFYNFPKSIIIFLLITISSISYGQDTIKKSIIFIDDFDINSTLEPDYYQYFDKIEEGKLLGDLNYSRINIDFDLGGPKSIRSIDLSSDPDYIVLILGTSATTLSTKNNTTSIAATDYKNEYLDLVRRITPKNTKVIVVSPPPYTTENKEEDKLIVENINAVQEVAESNKSERVYYVKLYKHILRNYQESTVSPKQLATWITELIKIEVKELDNQ
jgi:hypothetical protein